MTVTPEEHERLLDHVETHHKYFDEIHVLAAAALRPGFYAWRDFADRVFWLTHPDPSQRR